MLSVVSVKQRRLAFEINVSYNFAVNERRSRDSYETRDSHCSG